jgi:zinc/manganese transport system substrate-binding protein
MNTLKPLLLAVLAASASPAHAALQVFACEPEWGALARELGGAQVEVYEATTGKQDLHQIQARPKLLAKARNADLLVCSGAELEGAWLPLIVRQAGNPKVQPGRPGHFMASAFVTMLEVPTDLDRALGDVHPGGNPHIQTDPRVIAKVADALAQRMAQLDPPHAAGYLEALRTFQARWAQSLQRWQARAAPLRGAKLVAHHRSWPYLADWLGLEIVGYLEPKPGIPPSSAHLAALLGDLRGVKVLAIIRSGYEDPRPSEWLAERIGAPAVQLPQTVGATPAATDLFTLYDAMIDALLGAPAGAK